jgi:hypothetical protein
MLSDAIFRHFTSGAFRIDPTKFPENSGFVCFSFGKMAVLGPKTSKFPKDWALLPVIFGNIPD